MMSASQNPSTPEPRLEDLECHFTWDLDTRHFRLFLVRDKLEDIGTEGVQQWLGHIFNLQGFICHHLGLHEDALSFFTRAAESFRQARHAGTEEGPWLIVNYGNLAWHHHLLGEKEESQAYLLKVSSLLREHPSPSPDELHPEVCAEKASTLLKFGDKLAAAEYFRKAVEMQPDMVEWHIGHAVVLGSINKHRSDPLESDIFETIATAREQDPENANITVLYLKELHMRGENIEDETRELAAEVLTHPVSSYSGFKGLLRLYRTLGSLDEALDLAKEALERHPDERYLKRCAALCYNWRIVLQREPRLEQSVLDRAISLHKEVIALYPHSSLGKRINLANIYAVSPAHGLATADPIYQELLTQHLKPEQKVAVYNYYAKYLFYNCKRRQQSIKYHMKAAAIPVRSYFRDSSIQTLRKIVERGRDRMCREIQMFLDSLQL
ncbi:interferon-induced protein with tetratricopeptide repeats 5-like [Aulostomus maculatus]